MTESLRIQGFLEAFFVALSSKAFQASLSATLLRAIPPCNKIHWNVLWSPTSVHPMLWGSFRMCRDPCVHFSKTNPFITVAQQACYPTVPQVVAPCKTLVSLGLAQSLCFDVLSIKWRIQVTQSWTPWETKVWTLHCSLHALFRPTCRSTLSDGGHVFICAPSSIVLL